MSNAKLIRRWPFAAAAILVYVACDNGAQTGGALVGDGGVDAAVDGNGTGTGAIGGGFGFGGFAGNIVQLPDGAIGVINDAGVFIPIDASGFAGNPGSGGVPGTGGVPMATGGSGGIPTGPANCVPGLTECSDCKDNDNDGRTDYYDAECTGILDDREASFATGISGDNMDDLKSCKQDCFFDGNSGADEGCQRDLRCDPLRANQMACPYSPNDGSVKCDDAQPESCLKKCQAITPNGCDCFGCCQLPGAATAVRLVATCTVDKLNDATACPPCTQVTSCVNDCKPCEICIGKPLPDPSCFPPPPTGGTGGNAGTGGAGGMTGTGGTGGTGGTVGTGGTSGAGGTPPPPPPPPPLCPVGIIPCGPGGIDPGACPRPTYCITGCCLQPIL